MPEKSSNSLGGIALFIALLGVSNNIMGYVFDVPWDKWLPKSLWFLLPIISIICSLTSIRQLNKNLTQSGIGYALGAMIISILGMIWYFIVEVLPYSIYH